MEFKSITTKRLILRRLSLTDAETLSFYRSLPQVKKFQVSYSVEQALEMINQMNMSTPSALGKWFQFGIELKSNSCLIGDIGFLNCDGEKKSWIGYTLHPEYWGNGYASEAVRAIFNYYASLGVNEIWASTDPENDSSIKLLQNIGFVLVESKPKDMIFKIQV